MYDVKAAFPPWSQLIIQIGFHTDFLSLLSIMFWPQNRDNYYDLLSVLVVVAGVGLTDVDCYLAGWLTQNCGVTTRQSDELTFSAGTPQSGPARPAQPPPGPGPAAPTSLLADCTAGAAGTAGAAHPHQSLI